MEKVPTEETILRLCRAARALEPLAKTLDYPPPLDTALSEIQEAILDLAGLPETNWAGEQVEKDLEAAGFPKVKEPFVRDNFHEELDEFLAEGEPSDAGPLLEAFGRELRRQRPQLVPVPRT